MLRKLISTFAAISFVCSNIALADPAQNKIDIPRKDQSIISPDNIIIEKDHGLIKSKFLGNSNKLIINIQDAHCNYEAQTNIVNILETLIKNHSLSLISVEGADGLIDTTWFKAFPDEEVRKEVATYFMKKGEITGPEFMSITKNYHIKLFGAEDRAAYMQNLNAFTSSYPLKADTEKYYNSIKNALTRLKGYIYSNDLKSMDAKSQDYESKKMQFNDYVRFLQEEAAKTKINIRSYDNFFRLVSVLIYEKKIDFTVTDRERSVLIDDLSKLLSKDALAELVSRSISFKSGKISSVEFYNFLKKAALGNNIDLSKKYPNLYNYIIYNSVYSKIDNEKLFQDIKSVENDIKEKLFTNDDQRALDKLSRHIDILLGMVNIKLLNGDFNYYQTHKDEFTHKAFTDFIKKKAEEYALAYNVEEPADAVADSIPKLEDFYTIATKRDKALVDNTLAEMERENQNIAVLVTGGFHSEGMAKLLEKEGVSYIVVCPSITKDVPTPYMQILTNQRTPIEDILTSPDAAKKGMLAPISLSELVPMTPAEAAKFASGVPIDDTEIKNLIKEIINRADEVKKSWVSLSAVRWLARILPAAKNHEFVRDEKFMKDAYIYAMRLGLKQYLKESGKSEREAASAADKIVDAIIRSEDFDRIFSKSFARIAPKVEGLPVETNISLGEAYSSPEKFQQYSAYRIAELAKIIPELEGMMTQYRATTDKDEKGALAKKIDQLIKEKYNAPLVEKFVGSLADINEQNVVSDIPTLEEFRKSPDYQSWIDRARELIRTASCGKIDLYAGAASRLFGEGQGANSKLSFFAHDVYAVAAANNLSIPDGAIEGVSIGNRLAIQEWINVEEELRQYYTSRGIKKTDEEIRQERIVIIQKTPRIVIVNDESGPSIIKEFADNNFYGYSPELVIFVVQKTCKGFDLQNGEPKTIETSNPYPAGHGSATMQAVQDGGAFWVGSDGRVHVVDRNAVEYIAKQTNNRVGVFVQSRVNDMLKMGYSKSQHPELSISEIDLGIFALALKQMGDLKDVKNGKNAVLEQVGQDMKNPVKGGSPLRSNGKEFLVEGLAQSSRVTGLVAKDGVPFNRFFIFYKAPALLDIIKRNGLPVYLRFRDGYLYPETVTGDISMLDGINAGWALEETRQICDYKDTKTAANGINAAHKQDTNPLFKQYLEDLNSVKKNIVVTGLGEAGFSEDTVAAIRGNGGQSEQGAVTVNGAELTPEQKIEVNQKIKSDFQSGLDRLVSTEGGVKIYEIPSLESCPYLIAHPGRGGDAFNAPQRHIYMSPSRLSWYQRLKSAVQKQFLDHEIMHIDHPDWDEARVTEAAGIGLVLAATIDEDINQRIGDMSFKDVFDNPDKAFNVSVPKLIEQYGENVKWAIDRMQKSTAGTRGLLDKEDILGGPQLNAAVIAFMAQGYAAYINANFPQEQRAAFVGFDPRYFSREFAEIFTRVFLANGIKVYRDANEQHTQTPVTSYMAYHLKLACGIEITSSHNPPYQNGVKSMTWYGGVDTDDVSAKIVSHIQRMYDLANRRARGVIKVAPYDIAKIQVVDAKKFYYDNYMSRLFDTKTVSTMKAAMDSGARFIFDGLYGVAGPSMEYYLDRIFAGYDWHGKIIIMNATPDSSIGGIERPDPSNPKTLELSGVLEKLASTPGVLIAVTADMDADRIGTAVIIPDRDVERAKRYGLFVSQMKFGGQVVNIVRFTPNQIFTLISYERVLQAYERKLGTRDFAAIQRAIAEGKAPELYLLTSIPTSLIAKQMIETFGGKAILTTVGFKNLGYEAQELEKKNPNAIVISLMEESGGANIGPFTRDSRDVGIHRDKDTIVLALALFSSASRLRSENKNMLDLYIDMAEKLGGLFYYERLDAYLPNQAVAESLNPEDQRNADAIKQEFIGRYRAIDNIKEPGAFQGNLDNPKNVATLTALLGKNSQDIVKVEEAPVPNTVLLVGEGGDWQYVQPIAKRFTFKDREVIEVFHTGREDQEGPGIAIYNPEGKLKARVLLRSSGTESLIRIYLEIFEPQANPHPENLYLYFRPILEYLGLQNYSLKPGGTNYLKEFVDTINTKYNIQTPQQLNRQTGAIRGNSGQAEPGAPKERVPSRTNFDKVLPPTDILTAAMSDAQNGMRDAGSVFDPNRRFLPDKDTPKGFSINKPAETKERVKYINEKYVNEDKEEMRGTIARIGINIGLLKGKKLILAYDTKLAPEETVDVIQAGDHRIREYLGNSLIEIRGTGRALVNGIDDAIARLGTDEQYVVVTIAGDGTMKQVPDSERDILGKIINVQNPDDGRYIPIIGLYDLALRVAFEDRESIEKCLKRIDPNVRPEDVDKFLEDARRGFISITPAKPINMNEAREAYLAAEQALRSL